MKRTPGLDPQTTLAELRRAVQQFVEERDWAQFHTPKNLAMSIAIEAAELMEHFQWLTSDESQQALEETKLHAEITDEFMERIPYQEYADGDNNFRSISQIPCGSAQQPDEMDCHGA